MNVDSFKKEKTHKLSKKKAIHQPEGDNQCRWNIVYTVVFLHYKHWFFGVWEQIQYAL